MTVREYVGARYVPLFVGEWDNTNTYEPLSIVQYQGNSYTSRQYVPTGIAITNEAYWAETGNFNAQVEAYRQEVLTFDNRITANAVAISAEETARENADTALSQSIANEQVARLDADTALSQSIAAEETARENADTAEATARESADTALANRLTSIEGEIAELTARPSIYSYFYGFKMVVIGDSYAYGTGASDHLSGDQNRFSTILANRLGAEEINAAVGSTGFCDPGSGGQNKPFATQIDDVVNSMSTSDRSLVHLVLIAGGINDYREGSTYNATAMTSAASSCCEKAADGFPNAIILTVPMLLNGHDADPRLMNFENAIINGVAGTSGHRRNVYIKGAWTWNWGMASHYANDALHPNDLGHRVIANKIYANILGGEVYENVLESITFDSGYSSSVDNGGYFEFMNGIVHSFGTIVTLDTDLAANVTQKIGNVAAGCVPLVNVCTPITKSNNQVGVAIITTSGALYLHTTAAVASPCYIAPFNYIPKGSL